MPDISVHDKNFPQWIISDIYMFYCIACTIKLLVRKWMMHVAMCQLITKWLRRSVIQILRDIRDIAKYLHSNQPYLIVQLD